MFDNILKELKKIQENGGKISVPIRLPLDKEGYFDRRCPSAACNENFKILLEDWKEKVSNEQVFCPICREDAKATLWNTPQQQNYINQVGITHIRGIIDHAFSQDATDFNRSQRPGFISISMSCKPGALPLIVPINAEEELRQKFTCEQCECRYSSLGAAFFCPACGHNSAESTFAITIETVQKSLLALPAIQEAVRMAADADAARNTVREILENNMGRLVGAFQRIAEALFDRIPAVATSRRRNVFQNLAEGSALWYAATGKKYEDLLNPVEMNDLLRLFQQRHLLAHREGIVDQDYINKSHDTNYFIGQRIVIREDTVSRLAQLVTKLTEELKLLL